ncbi:hypothetical protein THAOC_00177 [Thalassiosira oceanica]|uniref:Uncharacterized protein n=1 Tax=Thalassiosira oceanica TaxID=159749 RepID=K0TGR8_THAOC|nr:hypothetical protein THAOC_00177 [Thalassiosira oceanica]|eukprot:EJK77953.1 hypothetical protein THAOC_00177 [Thalassiosira oceanica]
MGQPNLLVGTLATHLEAYPASVVALRSLPWVHNARPLSNICPPGSPRSASRSVLFRRQCLDIREGVTMVRSDQPIASIRRVFSDAPTADPSTGAGVDRPFISSLRPLQMGSIADAPTPPEHVSPPIIVISEL